MPDAAIPIFQTVNQQGEATLEVEAVIKALGLRLNEEEVDNLRNTIEWLGVNGQTAEFIQGFHNGANTTHNLELAAIKEPGNELSPDATMTLHSGVDESRINVQAGTFNRVLLDSNNRSSWLQIIGANAEIWRCNFGLVTGVPANSETRVSHGLGVAPTTVIASPSFNSNSLFSIESPNGTTFGFKNLSATFGCNFYWFAIG